MLAVPVNTTQADVPDEPPFPNDGVAVSGQTQLREEGLDTGISKCFDISNCSRESLNRLIAQVM